MEQPGAGGVILEAPPRRPAQYSYWCFTYNNPVDGTGEQLCHTLRAECDWFVFQEETGKEGTKHFQGTLKLKKRQRLTEIRRFDPNIHWEPTKSVNASKVYCTKNETRTGPIYTHGVEVPWQPKIMSFVPYGWQTQVIDIIRTEPDERTIHWFWESKGGLGKTTLCKYLVAKHNAIIVSGKGTDIFHALSKHKPQDIKIVVIDIPRSQLDYVSIGAIEKVKDGLFQSGKYEGCTMLYDCPHVFIFANAAPKKEDFSEDRWHIVEITG